MNQLSDKQTIICLAGMGRSGTSLMASYLEHCGVRMGREFLEPGKWNRKGFYEDTDFLAFHKRMLVKNRSNLYLPRRNLVVSAEDRENAMRMLQSRASENVLWGWKDPRSTLFVDLWSELDDRIKFIFLYRDPFTVIESNYRIMKIHHLYQPWLGPAGWLRYSSVMLEYLERAPDRAAFVSIHAFENNPEESRAILSEWLGIALEKSFLDVYDPSDRRTGTTEARMFPINIWMPIVERLYGKEIAKIHRHIESIALLPSGIKQDD